MILGLGLAASWLQAAEDNPVFKSVKYGIFVHHAWGGTAYALTKNPDLSVPKSIDDVADSFDIQRFLKDLQAFNPEYITFTAWHACMNPIFPSAPMDKWRGPGHAARRDVMGELIRELKPTGIKLFLYVHPSDGQDMTKEDQEQLGWNESIDQGKGWKPGLYIKWNNFMNEVFDEMCARYGKDVCGYWVDGGWERIDVKRLKNTVWKYNPQAEFVSGMDNAGWCDQFNHLCPPDPNSGIPAATPADVNTWPRCAPRGGTRCMRAPLIRSSSRSMATSDSNYWILASFAWPFLIKASRPATIAIRAMPRTLNTAFRMFACHPFGRGNAANCC